MYESPIKMIVDNIQTQMIQQEEEQLLVQVQKSLGFDIDKNELLKVLKYDRDQYEKGYKDGKNDVLNKIRTEIINMLYVDSLIFGELIDFKNGKIDADDVIEEFNRVTRLEVLKIIDNYKTEMRNKK